MHAGVWQFDQRGKPPRLASGVSAPSVDIHDHGQRVMRRRRFDLQSQRGSARTDESGVVHFVGFIIPMCRMPDADQRPIPPTVSEIFDQPLTLAAGFDARLGRVDVERPAGTGW